MPAFAPTANSPIEPAPLPEKAIIPLLPDTGNLLQPLVRRGDKVLTGQKIADSEKWDATPLHAPVSGEVSASIKLICPASGQLGEALVITSDGEDKWMELDTAPDPEALSTDEILEKIRQAGVASPDGDALPAHVKLKPDKNRVIDTIILSGCPCEPYVTADQRIMLEFGDEVLAGLAIASKLLSPSIIHIAIDDSRKDIINHLEKLLAITHNDIVIAPLKPNRGGRMVMKT